jgi:hypothetical protein
MSVDPFSKTSTRNLLQHVFIPEIVGSTAGYSVELNLQNISNIGASTSRVNDIWVNTLHFLNTDPVIGGYTGSQGGGTTGIPGPTGLQGPTGIQGLIGPTGPAGTGSSVTLSGPSGQIVYYGSTGLTSSSNFNISNNLLNLPSVSSLQVVNGSNLLLTTDPTKSYIQSGQDGQIGSGNTLNITNVGKTNNVATFDTLNTRVGVNNQTPNSTLDVLGQTVITFNGPAASAATTNVFTDTSLPWSIGLTVGTYNLKAWGQGGYGNGGAAALLQGTLNVGATGTLSAVQFLGATGGYTGGSALGLLYNGVTLAVVPGGGGAGAWYGSNKAQGLNGGYSATQTTGGTGGTNILGPQVASFTNSATLSATSILGAGRIIAGTTFTIPAGTTFTIPGSFVDNLIRGTLNVIPTGNISSLGITGPAWTTPVYSPSSNSVIRSPAFSVQQTLGISASSGASGPALSINANSSTDSPSNITVSSVTSTNATFTIPSSNIWRFQGQVGAQLILTLPYSTDWANISVNTSTNTAFFSAQTTVISNLDFLTLPTATVGVSGTITIPSGSSFPVSSVTTYANSGSFLAGGYADLLSGGGGAGYYGGGAGISGGGGGAGSVYLNTGITGITFTGSFISGSGSLLPYSGVTYGNGGINPLLPKVLLSQQISLPQPNPALIVNGNETIQGLLNCNNIQSSNIFLPENQSGATFFNITADTTNLRIKNSNPSNSVSGGDSFILSSNGNIGLGNGTISIQPSNSLVNVGVSGSTAIDLNVTGVVTAFGELTTFGDLNVFGSLNVTNGLTLQSAFIGQLRGNSLGMTPVGAGGTFVIAGTRFSWGRIQTAGTAGGTSTTPVSTTINFSPSFSAMPMVQLTSSLPTSPTDPPIFTNISTISTSSANFVVQSFTPGASSYNYPTGVFVFWFAIGYA